jgi:NCAIR mutase (PurE)-related protein
MLINILHQRLLDAGIPIVGVSGNGQPYRVDYADSATAQQRTQGDAMAAAFNPAAEQAALDAERDTRRGLAGAIQAELDYLEATIPSIDAMTAAQVRAVVKRLAQENLSILKLLRYVYRRME